MARDPENGRTISALLCGAGLVALIVNHFIAKSGQVIYLFPVFLGPMGVFLGAGGIVDPNIVWSIGKYGKHLPVKYKLAGLGLALLGVCVSAFLAFRVYRLF